MPTWLSLHVQTSRFAEALQILGRLSHARVVSKGHFPGEAELTKQLRLAKGMKPPAWLAVAQTQPDWITIRHGSCAILDEWIETLSGELRCTALQIQGQSVSEAYTLLVAKRGELTRMLQVCHEDDDHEPVNEGKREKLEQKHPFVASDFDLAWIAKYVEYLGLDVGAGYARTDWSVLEKPKPAAAKKKSATKKPATKKPRS